MNAFVRRLQTSALGRAAASPSARRAARVLRWALLAGVVVWLVGQLAGIGWAEVWAARPRTPWFYVIWLALYVQLPLIEAGVYRTLWTVRFRALLPPIVRKRALNQDVLSYSGEAYFFAWTQRHLGLSARRVAGTLKDNAIASSLGSWLAAGLLVSGFLLAGQLAFADLVGDQDPLVIGAVALGVATVLAVGLAFRRAVFSLAPRTVLALVGVHLARYLVLLYVLQIAQWWVVLPDTPLEVWATMLAVLTIVNRLPLIPSKDLVGVAAVLGMSDLLAASSAAIAAMLLTRSVLDKGANVLLFVGTVVFDRLRGTAPPPPPDASIARDPRVWPAEAPLEA